MWSSRDRFGTRPDNPWLSSITTSSYPRFDVNISAQLSCVSTRLTFGFVLMQTKEQAALSTITDCYLLSSPPVCWLWGSLMCVGWLIFALLSSHQTLPLLLPTHAINQLNFEGPKSWCCAVSHDVSCSLQLCSFKTNHTPNQIWDGLHY